MKIEHKQTTYFTWTCEQLANDLQRVSATVGVDTRVGHIIMREDFAANINDVSREMFDDPDLQMDAEDWVAAFDALSDKETEPDELQDVITMLLLQIIKQDQNAKEAIVNGNPIVLIITESSYNDFGSRAITTDRRLLN